MRVLVKVYPASRVHVLCHKMLIDYRINTLRTTLIEAHQMTELFNYLLVSTYMYDV